MNEEIENNEFDSEEFDQVLRPKGFTDFKGQDQIVDNLKVFIQAAKERNEALDHLLLHGPPGLGKTTLSHIVSNELEVGIISTSGPVLDKPADLAGLLTNLEERDVLFIDEIHRLNPIIEESRIKNICVGNIASIGQKESLSAMDIEDKQLGNKLGFVKAGYKDIDGFCNYFKSREEGY